MTKKICLLTILLLAALPASDARLTRPPMQTQPPTRVQPKRLHHPVLTIQRSRQAWTQMVRGLKRGPSATIRASRKWLSQQLAMARRTVRATSRSGEEKVVDTTEDVLQATGDKVADAAGFVADKAKTQSGGRRQGRRREGQDGLDYQEGWRKDCRWREDVGDKRVEGARTLVTRQSRVLRKLDEKDSTKERKESRQGTVKKVYSDNARSTEVLTATKATKAVNKRLKS